MSASYREYLSKFRHRIGRIFNRTDEIVAKSNILSSYWPVAIDNRHLETIKSSCNRLGNSLHMKIDFSLGKVSSIYDRISGRDVVNKALIELRQVSKLYHAYIFRLNKILCRRNLGDERCSSLCSTFKIREVRLTNN